MDGILKLLWTSGNELASGGAVSASLAILLVLLVKKVLAMILLVVLFVAFLMMAFRLTPAAVIEAVRSHERVPYEPEELPPQRSERAARQSAPRASTIDIPLDGEERAVKKTPRAAFSARSPRVSRVPTSSLPPPKRSCRMRRARPQPPTERRRLRRRSAPATLTRRPSTARQSQLRLLRSRR